LDGCGVAGIRLSSVSKAGLYAAIPSAAAGIALAPVDWRLHAALAGLGGGLLFPLSVYIVFVGSLVGGGARRGARALPAPLSVASAAAAMAAAAVGLGLWLPLASISLAALAAHVVVEAGYWRRRESWLPLLYPPLSGMLALASSSGGLVDSLLRLALYLDAPMIMAVAPMTVARNFGVRPWSPATLAPLIVNAAALAAAVAGSRLHTVLAAASMAVYFASVRVDRMLAALAQGRGSGVRAAAVRYAATGVLASLPPALLLAVLTAGGADRVALLHAALVGFAAVHIYTYSPLMLPRILKTGAPRSLAPIPPAAVSAAALLRPWLPHAAYTMMLAATAILLIQMAPRRPGVGRGRG